MSELRSAWEAWLDAPSGDAASSEKLAGAVARRVMGGDHQIVTIKPGRLGYRARCRCRWRSAYYLTPAQARSVGAEHVRDDGR